MKIAFTVGILLMFAAGILFIVFLLIAVEGDEFSPRLSKMGIILSAVVFVPAFVLTVFSGILVWKEVAANLKEQEKWRKRL